MNRNTLLILSTAMTLLAPLAQAQAVKADTPAKTERTRAEVQAELVAARAAGAMDFGLLEIFPDATPKRAPTAAK